MAMTDYFAIFFNWLKGVGIVLGQIPIVGSLLKVILVLMISALAYYLLNKTRRILRRRLLLYLHSKFATALLKTRFLVWLIQFAPVFIIGASGRFFFANEPFLRQLVFMTGEVYFTIIVVGMIVAVVHALYSSLQHLKSMADVPVKGIFQALNVVIYLIAAIVIVSTLLDRSPVYVISGLGALTAVLMLLFKDSILGFTAGVMLSTNKIIHLGDWIEMPDERADGNVIDVTLTSVKVRNWDNTITIIPAYNLISHAFKNWRGMEKSGGRRIKTQIIINIETVSFATETQLDHWRKIKILRPYLTAKTMEINAANQANGEAWSSPVNRRSLTNLGTFRAYCKAYFVNHPLIRHDMTCFTTLKPPTKDGVPVLIYCFTSVTAWTEYEQIQSDMMEHFFSILPEFGLKAYQSASASSIRAAVQALKEDAH